MPGYDYSREGWYFVTVCAKENWINWFGYVQDGEIILSSLGRTVRDQWVWLGQKYEYVKVDEFVVMPDHFHGILCIKNTRRGNPRIAPTMVSKNNINYHRRHNLLSKTMNAFKTTASKLIHRAGYPDFRWHRSFYDHIIRDKADLLRIQKYIRDNPRRYRAGQS